LRRFKCFKIRYYAREDILDDKDRDCRFACYRLNNNNFSYNNNKCNYCYYKDKNNRRLSNSFKAIFKGVKRLKLDKVKYFDKSNKTSIVAYYKRLNFLAYAYKELVVLVILLLYIRANISD
jgi:hypothetical protein